jgi:hypothetical protein
VLRNSKSSLTTLVSCFCSWIRLTADVRIIGVGLPVFPGGVSLHDVASLLAESVSISVVRSGAKKLRVTTSSCGVLTWADAAVGIAFLEVGAVSVVLCRLRLRTSWKPSSLLAELDWFFLL